MQNQNTRRVVSQRVRLLWDRDEKRHFFQFAALTLLCVVASFCAIGALLSADELDVNDAVDIHGPKSKPIGSESAKPLRDASKPTSHERPSRLDLLLRSPKPRFDVFPNIENRPALKVTRSDAQILAIEGGTTAASKQALTFAQADARLDRLIQQLASRNAEKRRSAATQLGWNGRAANRAIPALNGLLDDTAAVVRIAAASSIWEITRRPGRVVPILAELARSEDNSVALQATRVLGRIGTDAKRSLPDLRETLRSNSGLAQINIAETILGIDDGDAEAFELLSAAVLDREADIRCQAAYSLVTAINSRPNDIRRILNPVLHDDFEHVVAAAQSTLGQLGEAAEIEQRAKQDASQNKLSRLVLQLHNSDALLRKEALAHLAWLGADAKSVLYDIELRLKDESDVVRAAAAWAVWSVGGQGEAAVSTLQPLLAGNNTRLVPLAAEILGRLKQQAQPALGELRSRMGQSTGHSKIQFAAAIARIDPQDEAAVDVLVSHLSHADADIRARAAYAMNVVGIEQVGRVVSPLVKCLQDKQEETRIAAKLTLAEFLQSSVPGMASLTAYVVAGLGSDATSLVPILHDELKTGVGLNRVQIAEAIVRIDSLDIVAVDALVADLSANDSTIRCQAAYALSGVDLKLRERVTEALLQAAQDSNKQVCRAAQTTLKSLNSKTPMQADRLARATLASGSDSKDDDAPIVAPIPASVMPTSQLATTNAPILRRLPLIEEGSENKIVRTSNSVVQSATKDSAFIDSFHRIPVRLDRDLMESATIWSMLSLID